MPHYLLSESARQDILSIRDYTLETWGTAQAGKYLSMLKQRLEWLAGNPALGKNRDEVSEGYLSFPEGRHVIFYRLDEDGIEVIAIVHQSEDIDTHFSE
ncbi:MAG: plasmid stabilization protein ParE [Zetaproteobacteria bacterium CG1_02_53_45]|nr:MAG: plasmid stabilization protein ParE [Zetaproteobacteria bacterium CG1_02_53_45]